VSFQIDDQEVFPLKLAFGLAARSYEQEPLVDPATDISVRRGNEASTMEFFTGGDELATEFFAVFPVHHNPFRNRERNTLRTPLPFCLTESSLYT